MQTRVIIDPSTEDEMFHFVGQLGTSCIVIFTATVSEQTMMESILNTKSMKELTDFDF